MTLMTASTCPRPARRSPWTALVNLHALWRQRQALKTMDARTLKDIGLSPDQARAEAARSLWDAPETWLR